MDIAGISGGGIVPPRPVRQVGVGDDVAGAGGVAGSAEQTGSPGFGEMLSDGIESVANAEREADSLSQRFAVGDPDVNIQDVTVATTEAGLSVQLMVAVRDRALEAYQQIINLQV